MTNQYSTDRYPLPDLIDPAETVCYQVRVPKDKYHIAAFLGQLYALSYSQVWARDPTHKAARVARVWGRIFSEVAAGPNCPPCEQTSQVFDCGDENMIRQNPDNPCEIQTSADGIHWCTFIDLSKCGPGSGQPSGGTAPHAGGGEECYSLRWSANSLALVPAIVSAGDKVTLASAEGAGNSSGEIDWQCVDGEQFFAGACTGGATFDGGDPLPSAPHGSLIFEIDGVYYPAVVGSSVTVPGGVVNSPIHIQRNSSLAGASGSYSASVCVQNNAEATWCHTWDFAIETGPFALELGGVVSGTPGMWVPGTGWEPGDCELGAPTNYYRALAVGVPGSFTLTSIDLEFDSSALATDQPHSNDFQLLLTESGSHVFTALDFDHALTGSNQHLTWAGSYATSDGVQFQLVTSYYHSSATYAGSAVAKKLTLCGTGADPFV